MFSTRGPRLWLTLLASCAPLVPRAEEPPKLISVAEAWSNMARRETTAPIRVQGQVTFCDVRLGIAYFQDDTGGLGFDPRSPAAMGLAPGDTVQVEGYLARRQGLSMILRHRVDPGAPEVKVLARSSTRVQAIRFDLNDAAQMRIDGLLARVSGVIRRVIQPSTPDEPMMVEISTPSGHAIARLPWRETVEELHRWANAPVTLEAVLLCRAIPPMVPEGADALLLVPSKAAWTVQATALNEVFARPAVTAASAIQVAPRTAPRQRAHVMGTVTAAKAREWLTLRTEDGSVEVTTRQTGTFRPGELLSVACWPLNRNGHLILQDGVCRSLGQGPPPPPVKLDQGFLNLAMQRELVEVTGVVQNHSFSGASPRYTLALPNGLHCLLKWDAFLRREMLPTLQDGSVVRLAGILEADNSGSPDEDGAGFAVMPRDLADITVVTGPSWWTRRRLEFAIWGLLAVVGIALPGAAVFRWQVWRQSQHIRRIESRAATGEERRRIAREFHDSLQQQLAGAALHLETVKGALQAAPDMLPRLIDDTTAMIRHCQMEAQHCIWDLRTELPARNDLPASLAAWLRTRAAAGSVAVDFHAEGQLPDLGDKAPFQILRICQEAVNNALAHAAASRVTVSLTSDREGVKVKIADDGTGFDTRLIQSPKPGHFGLSSLRERARNIGAQLNIQSVLLKGTTVSLSLPTANKKHESAR